MMKQSKPEHEAAYQDLCAWMKKHGAKLSSLELLAIASNAVGKIIALQDQRKVTSEMAMTIVGKNIEIGNAQAIEQVMNSKGNG